MKFSIVSLIIVVKKIQILPYLLWKSCEIFNCYPSWEPKNGIIFAKKLKIFENVTSKFIEIFAKKSKFLKILEQKSQNQETRRCGKEKNLNLESVKLNYSKIFHNVIFRYLQYLQRTYMYTQNRVSI